MPARARLTLARAHLGDAEHHRQRGLAPARPAGRRGRPNARRDRERRLRRRLAAGAGRSRAVSRSTPVRCRSARRRTSAFAWSPAATRSRRTTSTSRASSGSTTRGRRRTSRPPPIRITLEVTANAGSMSLNPRQTCCGLNGHTPWTRSCSSWPAAASWAGLVLLGRGFGGYRDAARISDTSPSRIASIAVGEVLVSGVVEPAELTLDLAAPERAVRLLPIADRKSGDDEARRSSARRPPSGSASGTRAVTCASSRGRPVRRAAARSTSGRARSAIRRPASGSGAARPTDPARIARPRSPRC